MNSSAWDGKSEIVWAGWAAVGMALLFVVPYFVPIANPVDSLSARVGYNNTAAKAIALGSVLMIALARFWFRRTWTGAGEANEAIGKRWLILTLAAVTVRVVVVAWIMDGPRPATNESYFLSRLLHMQAGHTPYRDFEFNYGPAMVYVPYWFERAGLSAHYAYSATMWLFEAAGISILWALLRFSQGTRELRTGLFLVLAAGYALCALDLSLQYTLMRYLCGFGALLAIDLLSQRFGGWWPVVLAGCAGGTAGALLISPEIGLALIAAVFAYLGIEIWRGSYGLLWAAGGYAVFLGWLYRLLPEGMFHNVSYIATGAFPVLPSAYMLLYAGSLFWIMPAVGAGILAALGTGGKQWLPYGVALTSAFAANTMAMVPGAMERADPVHVFFYGFGVFLLAMLRIGRTRFSGLAYIGVFAALLLWVNLSGTFAAFRSHGGQKFLDWAQSHPDSGAQRIIRKLAGAGRWKGLESRLQSVQQTSLESSYPALGRYGRICMPFADETESYFVLARHGNLKMEYYVDQVGIPRFCEWGYPGTTNLYAPVQVPRIIGGLRGCDYLILPNEILPPPSRAQEEAADRGVIREVLMFPFPPRDRGPRLPNAARDVLQYIADRYGVVERLNSKLSLYKAN